MKGVKSVLFCGLIVTLFACYNNYSAISNTGMNSNNQISNGELDNGTSPPQEENKPPPDNNQPPAVKTWPNVPTRTGNIVVNSNSKGWLKYESGRNLFVAGAGDPEDFLYRGSRNADGTRRGDQETIINNLGNNGTNSIYFQVIRSHGGDGEADHNPFNNSNPANGLNQNILKQWKQWFALMDQKNIVAHIFIYDDNARIWNGNSVTADEENFLKAIVNSFKQHKNIVWVLAEEYAERFSPVRVSDIARVIKENDSIHPVGVHKNEGLSFSEFANDPNLDLFMIQFSPNTAGEIHSGIVGAYNDANGKYVLNLSESADMGTGNALLSKSWAAAMAGSYVMVFEMNSIDTPTQDLKMLGYMSEFFEQTKFDQMAPNDQLGSGTAKYVLSHQSGLYIVYADQVGRMGINQAVAGVYNILWFNPATGNSIVVKDHLHSGGALALDPPSICINFCTVYLENQN